MCFAVCWFLKHFFGKFLSWKPLESQTVWIQIRSDILSDLSLVHSVCNYIRPDLGPKCLQRLSADDTSRQRAKIGVIFGNVNYVWSFNSQVHNLKKLQYIYHLKKLKLCLFNNEFKVRLLKVTYLGYIWNDLRQGQILGRQKYNLFKLKSSLFFWSSMTSRTNF